MVGNSPIYSPGRQRRCWVMAQWYNRHCNVKLIGVNGTAESKTGMSLTLLAHNVGISWKLCGAFDATASVSQLSCVIVLLTLYRQVSAKVVNTALSITVTKFKGTFPALSFNFSQEVITHYLACLTFPHPFHAKICNCAHQDEIGDKTASSQSLLPTSASDGLCCYTFRGG